MKSNMKTGAKNSTFFNLPVEVSRYHILPFLDHVDLVSLDRATTNHCFGQRKYVLEAFRGLFISSTPYQSAISVGATQWMISRGLKLKTLFLKIDNHQLEHYLPFFSLCEDLENMIITDRSNSGLVDDILFLAGQYCSKLQFVDFSDCPSVGDSGVRAILQNNPSLLVLNLTDCSNISNKAFLDIANCSSFLKALLLSGTVVSGATLAKVFPKCPELRRVELTHCDTSDESIIALAKSCHDLKVLDIGGGIDVSDESLFALAMGCKQLRRVDISCCNVTNRGVQALSLGCKNLKKMALSDCSFFTPSVFKHMPPSIREVNLSDSYGITDQTIIELLSACPEIEILNLENCRKISNAMFNGVTNLINEERSSNLHTLNLNGCSKISDEGILTVLHAGARFRKIELSGCTEISDTTVNMIAERSPDLEFADFSNCGRITDGSVSLLARNCPHLEILKVPGCGKLSDMSIGPIIRHCVGLCTLNIQGCYKVTDAALLEITENRELLCKDETGLVYFNAADCPRISDEGVSAIIRHSPQLTYFCVGSSHYTPWCSSILPSIHNKVNKRLLRPDCFPIAELSPVTFIQLVKCPNLTTLKLNGAIPKLTDLCLCRVLPCLPALEELDISGSSLITDAAFAYFAVSPFCAQKRTLAGLRELNVSGLENLSAVSMVPFVRARGSSLQRLEVAGCRKLSDDAFIAICNYCPGIEHLNMAGCIRVTDSLVNDHLPTKCQELQSIDLSFCFSLSTLRGFVECRYLQQITLRKAENVIFLIPSQDIQYLYNNCPELQHVAIL